MNKKLVDSHCSLSSIREDITASLSILKILWRDKKIASTVNKTIDFFDQCVEATCTDACKQCHHIFFGIVQHLNKVGLEQAFFNLLVERQYLKNNFQQNRRLGKAFKKNSASPLNPKDGE